MALLDRDQQVAVRWTVAVQRGGHLAEVGGAEEAGRGDGENRCLALDPRCPAGWGPNGRRPVELAQQTGILVERLEADDAAALDLDPGRVTYTALGDLATSTEKARRDTPAIAVCEV